MTSLDETREPLDEVGYGHGSSSALSHGRGSLSGRDKLSDKERRHKI
jgi:hypothetical protein